MSIETTTKKFNYSAITEEDLTSRTAAIESSSHFKKVEEATAAAELSIELSRFFDQHPGFAYKGSYTQEGKSPIYKAYAEMSKAAAGALKECEQEPQKETLKKTKQAFKKAALRVNQLQREDIGRLHSLHSDAFDPLTEPTFGTYSYLNAKETCEMLQYQNQIGVEYRLDAFLPSLRAQIVLNTFIDYCDEHPETFLNHVCRHAVIREVNAARREGAAEITTLGKAAIANNPVAIKNALAKVLKDYLNYEQELMTLNLDHLDKVFPMLEKIYQKDEFRNGIAQVFTDILVAIGAFPVNEWVATYQSLQNPRRLGFYLRRFHNTPDEIRVLRPERLHEETFKLTTNAEILPPEFYIAARGLTRLEIKDSTKLKKFELEKLPRIQRLKIYDVDELRTIDTSKCANLMHLYIDHTKIEKLDVSRNSRLRTLFFSNAFGLRTDSLDLKLPESGSLTQLNLATISLSNDPDLKKAGLYDQKKLEYLGLFDCKEAKPDLSRLTSLKTLDLRLSDLSTIDLTNNHDLEAVDFSDSDFEHLDLSNKQKLRFLSVYDANRLKTLNLENTPQLEDLFVKEEPNRFNDDITSVDNAKSSGLEAGMYKNRFNNFGDKEL